MTKYSFKLLFYILFTFILVSCQDKSETVNEVSVFKVNSNILKCTSEGGTVTLSYSSIGKAYGKIPNVEVDKDWLSINDISSTNIELSVAANDSQSDRSAKLVLSGYNADPITVHIVQSKVSDSQQPYKNFTVNITDISSSSAKIEVDPLNPSAYYYTDLFTASQYNTYGEDYLVQSIIDYIANLMSFSGVEDPRVFLYQGYYNTAYDENVSMDLRDNTDYYVAVVGMNVSEDGVISVKDKGEFHKFRTLKASQVDMDFSFAISGSQVEVTPSADYTYVCGVASKSQWDAYSDYADAARDYIAIAKQYSMLETIVYTGKRTVDFTYLLEKSGEYVVYAVGYRNTDKDKGITTAVSYKEFTYTAP